MAVVECLETKSDLKTVLCSVGFSTVIGRPARRKYDTAHVSSRVLGGFASAEHIINIPRLSLRGHGLKEITLISRSCHLYPCACVCGMPAPTPSTASKQYTNRSLVIRQNCGATPQKYGEHAARATYDVAAVLNETDPGGEWQAEAFVRAADACRAPVHDEGCLGGEKVDDGGGGILYVRLTLLGSRGAVSVGDTYAIMTVPRNAERGASSVIVPLLLTGEFVFLWRLVRQEASRRLCSVVPVFVFKSESLRDYHHIELEVQKFEEVMQTVNGMQIQSRERDVSRDEQQEKHRILLYSLSCAAFADTITP